MSTKAPVPADPESVPFVQAGASELPHTASTLKVAHGTAGDLGYPVADFVGRCFLRLCMWVDLFAPWTRRDHAPAEFPDNVLCGRIVTKAFQNGGDADCGSVPQSSTTEGAMATPSSSIPLEQGMQRRAPS